MSSISTAPTSALMSPSPSCEQVATFCSVGAVEMGAAAGVGRALGVNPGSSKSSARSAGDSMRAGLLNLRRAFSLPWGRGVSASPDGIRADATDNKLLRVASALHRFASARGRKFSMKISEAISERSISTVLYSRSAPKPREVRASGLSRRAPGPALAGSQLCGRPPCSLCSRPFRLSRTSNDDGAEACCAAEP